MRKAAALVMALVGLSSWACASGGAVPRPFPRPADGPPPARSPAPDEQRVAEPGVLVAVALSLQGAPYRDGGADPSGFDCSGFVSYVFAQQGRSVPRTVSEQFELGAAVPRGAVAAGDLVFFSTISPGASHVGIAVSGEEFVHAPTTSGVVRVESLGAPYWSARFVGARRLD